jgi:BON domain
MMTRDELLCEQVQDALERDRRVADESLLVHSHCGIVTLEGRAPSNGSILAAIEVAASFPKCRGVVNRQVLTDPQPVCYESLWGLPAADGIPGRSGGACLPNDGQPISDCYSRAALRESCERVRRKRAS